MPAPPATSRIEGRLARRYRRSLKDRGLKALLSSPAYLVAIFFHAFILVVLSFITVAAYVRQAREPLQAKLAARSEVVVPEVTARAADTDVLEAPSIDELRDMAEVDVDSNYQEALGSTAGHQSDGAGVFGAGGGGGFGRGGRRGSRGGPSGASEGAVRTGLDWLIRHQSADGAWGTLPPDHAHSGRLPTEGDVACTGLAVVALIAADHRPGHPGPLRDVVEKAVAWLVERVDDDGMFRRGARQDGYHQAIGTLALGEALQHHRTEELEAAVRRAVDCIEDWRTSLGWRYRPRHETDTSVTSWMVLALKSAETAGVEVHPAAFDGVRTYLQQVSLPTGATRYTPTGRLSPGMTASGLFMRVILGEEPTTPLNAAAARLVVREGETTLKGGRPDLYQIYYAALGLYQVGGEPWREFNPLMRETLVEEQVKAGCEAGSWPTCRRLSDPVLSTVFATLCLETYYRYLPVHDGVVHEAPTEPGEEAPRVSPAQAALEEASLLLARAEGGGDPGLLLAAEAKLHEALDRATDEEPGGRSALEACARARLVEVAFHGGDPEEVLSRTEAYLAAEGYGDAPDPAILRARRLAAHQRAVNLARAAAADPGDVEARERARAALEEVEALVTAELPRLLPDESQEAIRLRAEARDLLAVLAAAGAPKDLLAASRRAFRGRPPEGPAEARERALVQALLARAVDGYRRALEAEPLPFAAAEEALALALERDLVRRLAPGQAAPFRALVERALLLRSRALLSLGRPLEALAAVARFRAAFPGSELGHLADGCERGALAEAVRAGAAGPAERARLTALVVAWVDGDAKGEELLRAAATLEGCGAVAEAARVYERALVGARPAEEALQARLGAARCLRRSGRAAEALAHLDRLPADAGQRLDVRLELARARRAAGDLDGALEGLLAIVDALRDERPPAWWDAVYETSEVFVAARRLPDARRFLAGVHRLDPTFGGDDERRFRFAERMHELEVMRE